jgi:MtrB/PioB family decaheme-associated outer membrane protein
MTSKHRCRHLLLACISLVPAMAFAQEQEPPEATPPAVPVQPPNGAPSAVPAAPPEAAPPPTEAAAPALLVPPSGGYVDIGGGYVSTNSPVFGRYTGLTDRHAFGIGDFIWVGRDPWDSGGTRYWALEGYDLGLTSRSFNLDYGQQGSWGMNLFYEGIPYFQSNKFTTIYDTSGKGTLNGGAPVPSVTPFFQSGNLARFLNRQDLKTQRDIAGGGVKFTGLPGWIFSTELRHEHKEGSLENSLTFGTGKNPTPQGGATPTATTANVVYFPMPVDFDIDRIEAKADYAALRYQAQLKYEFSNFTDNNSAFNAIDPFLSPQVTVGNPNGTGTNSLGPANTVIRASYAQPPSNQAHEITATVAYNFTPTARLVATGAWGLWLQNDDFAAPTNNPFVIANNPTLTTGGSLHGKVQTLFGNVTFTARPLPHTDVKLAYTVDSHDDDTPRRVVAFTQADSLIAIPPRTATTFIYSSTIETATAEAAYRFAPQSKVTAGYQFKAVDRTDSPVDHQQENRGYVRVNSVVAPGVSTALGWEHAIRTAGNPNPAYPWSILNIQGGANQSGSIINFTDGQRTQDRIRGRASAVVNDEIQAGLEAHFTNNRYGSSFQGAGWGLRADHSIEIGPDITYNPTPTLSTSAFYSFEQIYRKNIGNISSALGTWFERTNDQVHTAGIRTDWRPKDNPWSFSATYNFIYGDVGYTLADNVTAAQAPPGSANQQYLIQPFPDLKTQLHSVSLIAEYKVLANLSLLGGYTFERLIYSDAGIQASSNPLQFGSALLPGEGNPSYVAHVVSAAVRYRF